MTRYVLAIKRIRRIHHALSGALLCFLSASATAEIDIGALGGQSTMAEQGAICASFSALMENQSLINEDLGALWAERRKFSGAVIRRAVELSDLPTPSGKDIDLLINDYREWLILNLSSQDSNLTSSDYQSDIQDLIKTNCKSLYLQADKAIMKRYPELTYLIDKQAATSSLDLNKQVETLLAKNGELNLQIIALKAEMSALKQAQKQLTKAPKTQAPKIQAPKTQAPNAPKPRPALTQKTANTSVADDTKKTISERRFFAQLGSFSNETSAQMALADFKVKYPTLFDALSLQIAPHQFASGKTFYRVQTTSGARASITAICDKLWEARMGCLIKTNSD